MGVGKVTGQEDKIAEAYLEGQTIASLAKGYGVSETTIKNALGRVGARRPPPPPPPQTGTPEHRALVVSLKKQGKRVRDIARAVGSRDTTVAQILQEEGLHHKRKRGEPAPFARKISPEQEVEVAQKYKDGMGSEALAKEYGCTARTVVVTLRRQGVEIRGRGGVSKVTPDLEEAMVSLWNQGLNQTVISKKVGVGQTVVSRILRTRGLGSSSRRGVRHGNWKGGKASTDGGYILTHLAYDHPFSSMRNQAGYVPEHRLVMAQHLGRSLRKSETVHHINGDRSDNRIENLQLRQGNHGNGVRMRCACCGSENLEPVPLD